MHFRIHSITDTTAVPVLINVTHQVMSEVSTQHLKKKIFDNYLQSHVQRAVLSISETKKGLK